MQLKVKVNRIVHPKIRDTFPCWAILITDKGTCKGSIGWDVKEDELLCLEGEYSVWRGQREFKFTGCAPDLPVDPRHQLHYCCERTNGVGPSLEEAIWKKYGLDWQQIKPGEIKGMTAKKFEAFRLSMESLKSDVMKVDFISFLMGKGATMTLATSAWNRWEMNSLGVINADCYRLAELPHHGFSEIDTKIRHNFGIADTDPRRIKAIVDYAMKQLTKSGSTVVGWNELLAEAGRITGGGVDQKLIALCVGQMFGEGKLFGFNETGMICRASDYKNEKIIWEFLA